MTNIIIFEGPDSCGKTHMAKSLSKVTGIPYFKNNDEHRYFIKDPQYFIHAIRYVDTYFTSYLETTGASIILDRSWPSEWIYSKVMNRQTDLAVLKDLDSRHSKLGTKIIIPWRSDYSKIDDDYEAVNNNIQKIHDLYIKFAKEWTSCKTLLLNVDDENLDRELSEIRGFLGL